MAERITAKWVSVDQLYERNSDAIKVSGHALSVVTVEDHHAEIAALRAEVERLRDNADLLNFYFNHHVNAGGRTRWIVESPMGRMWVLLEDVEHHRAMHARMYGDYDSIKPDWQMIEGPGERQDFPKVEDAIREARRRSSDIWDVPESDGDAAREATS